MTRSIVKLNNLRGKKFDWYLDQTQRTCLTLSFLQCINAVNGVISTSKRKVIAVQKNILKIVHFTLLSSHQKLVWYFP